MSNMSLKEAFRYQNKLSSIYGELRMYLRLESNVVCVTEKHMRTKANPEAADETLRVLQERKYNVTTASLIALMIKVMQERASLAEAIEKAKRGVDYDIDCAINVNGLYRELAMALEAIASVKPKKKMRTGTGYKFDVEGKQQPYVYDIEETTTVEFDRGMIKKIANSYLDRCDAESGKIDGFMLEPIVCFEPMFGMNENIEDIVLANCEEISDS